MAKFCRWTKNGKRTDDALRDAMLTVKDTKPRPYCWAAFQNNGDTGVVHL